MSESRLQTSHQAEPQDGLAGRKPSQGGLWSETEPWRLTGSAYEAPLTPCRIEFGPEANRQSLKRLGKRERILARLKAGPARTWDLMLIGGAGFSSRLRELREMGYDIPPPEQDEVSAVYRLVGEPPA